MADWASEGGHWYDSVTGEPRYTIVGKNGVERATTLRDARPNKWVPGVTTITACAARFALEKWKAEQLLLAGLTLTKRDRETEADWVDRVWADSQEQSKKAAKRGTVIHAAVEAHYAGQPYDIELKPWVESISNLLQSQCGSPDWRPEKSFASALGYGGKVDLHSDHLVIDFKGKEGDRSKWNTYDEYAMQLAAYAHGLGIPEATCGIVFFDRAEPYSELHVIRQEELNRGWEMFRHLLAYWKVTNRYMDKEVR